MNIDPWMKNKHKSKIGFKLRKKNFIEIVNHFNSFENMENLKIKEMALEVYLLDVVE